MISQNIRCAIIANYPFPVGLAATNRILAYSKGMIENGAYIDVYIPIPTERASTKATYQDIFQYQDINFVYTIGRTSSKYKFIRAISILSGYRFIIGYISTCTEIFKQHKRNKYNCIIISTDQIVSLSIYSTLAKHLNIKSIFIFDEYPIPIRHKLKSSIPKWKEFLYKKVLKHVSGYISISQQLSDYFNRISPKETALLPLIVDVSRFNNDKILIKNSTPKYICYMGNMELSKDDVDNIIKAFSIISENVSFLSLYLFGDPDPTTQKYLNELIIKLNLQNRIFLKGKVASDKVPSILMNAHILVSSQPDTMRASGGFPTKLGEYLTTGIPTLITDVGENSRYAKNNEHLFFAIPGDPKSFAEKLLFIIENYEFSLSIAKNGRELIINNYSHTSAGNKLLKFIISLKSVI